MNLRKQELNALLGEIEMSFPTNIRWYSVDGIRAFELRGQSGGVVSSVVAYLVTKVGEINYRFGMRFVGKELEAPFDFRIEIREFVKEQVDEFLRRLGNPSDEDRFDPDGGDMGVPTLRVKRS